MGIGKTKRDRRNDMRAAARRVGAVLVVGVMIVSAMYLYNYLTTSERFSVTSIEFAGLSRVDGDGLDALMSDLIGENLFLAPLERYESRLEAHPRVSRAVLHRVLLNRVTCTIEEREPVALIFVDRFLEVDAHGMVMKEDGYTALLDLPIITGLARGEVVPGEQSDSPRLQRALNALALCKRFGGSFASDISEMHVGSSGVTIRAAGRDCVLLLGDANYERRLKKYFLLQDMIVERNNSTKLIDLRFEDQIVLRGRI